MSNTDDAVTDEIMEIFSEEVAEVLVLMDENLADWKQNPENDKALKEVRRAFHTLKGSGRMVQAFDLGELAWAVESLLNSVIEGSQKPIHAIFELLADVRPVIPKLLSAFESGSSASDVGVPLHDFIQRAEDIPHERGPVYDPQTGQETSDAPMDDANDRAVQTAELDLLAVRVNQFDDQLVKLKAQLSGLTGELAIAQKLQQSSPKRQEVEAVKRQADSLGREINDLKYFVKNSTEQTQQQIQDVQQQTQKNVSEKLGDLDKYRDRMMGEMDKRLEKHTQDMNVVALKGAFAAFSLSALMIIVLVMG
ncbi:Uncharacterised protein [BD1-7 clade bacterium]|uniref:HPt domain-containing protein n=1 Tax=BD1-7 clade bacterium TaxID=2029982 RepID=A0A5S9PV68_9GAMM|nr:Uncharacterised protein [BD1-7 clade bacterium]